MLGIDLKEEQIIEARGLAKRYRQTLAVDELSFTMRPGVVTGFLGPNGSGKTTTMRMIVGLDAPDAGFATVKGRPCRYLPWPLQEVGARARSPRHPSRSQRRCRGLWSKEGS